jgi:hypothetical protein
MGTTFRYQIRLQAGEYNELRARKVALGRTEIFVEEERDIPGQAHTSRDGRALIGAMAIALGPWRTSSEDVRLRLAQIPFDVLLVQFESVSDRAGRRAARGQIRPGSLGLGFYQQQGARDMVLLPHPRLTPRDYDGIGGIVRSLISDAFARGREGRVFDALER